MRPPEFVTFTGVDASTDLDEMQRLSDAWPIEWGILFSPRRQGVEPRYPDEATVRRVVEREMRFAAHMCGEHARMIVAGMRPNPMSLPPGSFERIQVNHAEPDAARISFYAMEEWGARGIGQWRGDAFPDDDRIDWLYDRSGGRGIAPASWPPHPGRFVGYAGGIGADNAADVVASIGAAGPYALDMENGIRTDDRLDLALCRRVCEAVFGAA